MTLVDLRTYNSRSDALTKSNRRIMHWWDKKDSDDYSGEDEMPERLEEIPNVDVAPEIPEPASEPSEPKRKRRPRDGVPPLIVDINAEAVEPPADLWMPTEAEIAEWRKYFPMAEFRQWQEQTVEAIIKGWASGKKYAVVEGPTGSGKSAWAITLGRLFGNTFLCTPQKMLQNQYMKDFPQYLFELKGRATYPCLRINYAEWLEGEGRENENTGEPKKRKRGSSNGLPREPEEDLDFISLATWNDLPKDHPQRRYNCANAPCNGRKNGTKLKAECKQHGVCQYIKRRDHAFIKSRFSLFNFSNMMLFTLLMPAVYDKRPLLIMDECHTLETFLYDYATIPIGLKQFALLEKHLGDVDFKRVAEPFTTMADLIAYILDKVLPAYDLFKESDRITNGVQDVVDPAESIEKPNDERQVLSKLIDRLRKLVDEKPTDHSHVLIPVKEQEGREEVLVGYKIKPFSVAGLAHMAFGSSHSRVLLMSATILDPTTFCKSVGIKQEDVFFIRVPSTFPAENRLIVGDTTVGSMAYKHKEKTLPIMLDRILELSEKHSMHKGIIHTGNYENMNKFKRWLEYVDPILRDRVLFQSQGTFEEKEKIIKVHALSDEPLILCGPGFLEGIDLKDDLARFNIIMKLPFLSLADPHIKRKAEEFPEWYSLQVALALIQAIGRPVRSPTDWAMTYILDLLWKFFYERNQDRLFPKHIQNAVRWITNRDQKPHL